MASSDNDQYRSRNALIRRHIEKMDASLHVGTKEFDISKVSEVDSVDDLLIDNAARYLLKDWKGVGELVNGVEVALEYTAERGIALLKQNPELYWQILAEAASIAQGKEQQKQDTSGLLCWGEIIIPGLDLRKAEITELQYRTMSSRMIIYRFCFWIHQ